MVGGMEDKNNIEREIDFIWQRISALNEDINNFSSMINTMNNTEDKENLLYRKFLLKRIHETDVESDELYKKVKLLEAQLKSITD